MHTAPRPIATEKLVSGALTRRHARELDGGSERRRQAAAALALGPRVHGARNERSILVSVLNLNLIFMPSKCSKCMEQCRV